MPLRKKEPVYTTAVFAGLSLFKFWRLKRTIIGASNLPDDGGAVLAITHFGYLEFALVEWATWSHNRRRIRFMVKQGAFDKPVVGSLLRAMRHIPVDMKSGGDAYSHAVTALRNGELLGVFPEAGVDASFTVRELKTGAARLAAEAGVPIIPVAVWGGQRLMTKNREIKLRDRFGVHVSFAFGEPIATSEADDPRAVTEQLRQRLQELVAALRDSYPLPGPGRWWYPAHLGGNAPTPAQAVAADEERDRLREEASEAEEAQR